MCKKTFSVRYGAGTGRLQDVRVSKKGILVGTFRPNTSPIKSTVKISKVEPTNRKSAKKLESELNRVCPKRRKSSTK